MKTEIERKYLVANDRWRKCATSRSVLHQAYLTLANDRMVRIRTVDGTRATLTVKIGASHFQREEFEYDVPYCEAVALMAHRVGVVLEKIRYGVRDEENEWWVDVYEGLHSGLVVAEIELQHADVEFPLPVWVGREITGDQFYSNQILALSLIPLR